MNSIISLFLSFLLAGGGWGNNLEEALAEANATQKLVMLNFSGSDWCAPCIQLKKEIFGSEAFGQLAASRLVLVRADFPRMKKNQLPAAQLRYNEGLAEKYNPSGKFPLTLLLSADGTVLHTWEGYPKDLTPEKMIKAIQTHW